MAWNPFNSRWPTERGYDQVTRSSISISPLASQASPEIRHQTAYESRSLPKDTSSTWASPSRPINSPHFTSTDQDSDATPGHPPQPISIQCTTSLAGEQSRSRPCHEQPSVQLAPSKKRQRKVDERDTMPATHTLGPGVIRRRAVTACQICRARKTKCDNRRPTCGICAVLGQQCVYTDNPETDPPRHSDAPITTTILERVNHAITILESHGRQLSKLGLEQQRVLTLGESGDTSHGSSAPTDTLIVSDCCSSARILEWPIFGPNNYTSAINDAFLRQTRSTQNPPCRTCKTGRGVREEDAVSLVSLFLQKVHIKNPILDPDALISMARHVAEEGYSWDEKSCLVMIACALASIAKEFALAKPSSSSSSCDDVEDYSTAELYYAGARKRIGVLDHAVLSTQCSFLVGVYEMYSMRPLKAWLSFNNASMIFQAYLHCSPTDRLDQSTRRMEQRLYWTCLKSECEMREEIDLGAPVGLARMEYPDGLPSPPSETWPVSEAESLADDVASGAGSRTSKLTDQLRPCFRRSWYYYLSEIASRRIANSIIHALYADAPQAWLSCDTERLRRIATELDAQVIQWSEHLPLESVDDPASDETPDELHHLLRSRFLELRERIWRPFLFLAIHSDPATSSSPEIRDCAETALSLVFQSIENTAVKHRHHGSWYGARENFSKALLILAAMKSGRIPVGAGWEASLDMVQTQLEYWEVEAPDLGVARLALAEIAEQCRSIDG